MAENYKSLVWFVRAVYCFALINNVCFARKHNLHIKADDRKEFVLSTFGFLKGGELTMHMSGFTSSDGQSSSDAYGFTLDRSSSAGASKYLEGHDSKCVLQEDNPKSLSSISLVSFRLNLKDKRVEVDRLGHDVQDLEISYQADAADGEKSKADDTAAEKEEGKPPVDETGGGDEPAEQGGEEVTKVEAEEEFKADDTAAEKEGKPLVDETGGGDEPADQGGEEVTKVEAKAGNDEEKGGAGGTADGEDAKKKEAEEEEKGKKTAKEQGGVVADGKEASDSKTTTASPPETRKRRAAAEGEGKPTDGKDSGSDKAAAAATVPPMKSDITWKTLPENVSGIIPMCGDKNGYNVSFRVRIVKKEQAGLFNVFFHNCRNYGDRNETQVSFALKIVEKNEHSYLSAGNVPLPMVYFSLSACFFVAGLVWFMVLRHAPKQDVFKLHYIMLTVVWMKCIALLFHAVDYHFIGKEGVQEEGWAIVFYIAHLVKGALLFSTIVLIGAGWSFIKHMLSDNVKKVFLIVIPLQILANTASIIIEETEESAANYSTWHQVFILVDLLCCGAILFPVVWSIRHLQEGAEVDGKAAMNLQKLQLFKQFYIIVVCYIYFTRIIVYLLNATLPFQYTWIDEVIREGGTLFFFVLTGSKFRPADNNPYLQVPQEDDDDYEMEEVITTTGATESLRRVNTGKDSDDGSDAEVNTAEIKHREKSLVD